MFPDHISLLGILQNISAQFGHTLRFQLCKSGILTLSSVFSALGSQIYIAWYAISFGYTAYLDPRPIGPSVSRLRVYSLSMR